MSSLQEPHTEQFFPLPRAPLTGLPSFYLQAHPSEYHPLLLPTFFWACKISLSTGDTKMDPPS